MLEEGGIAATTSIDIVTPRGDKQTVDYSNRQEGRQVMERHQRKRIRETRIEIMRLEKLRESELLFRKKLIHSSVLQIQ